MISTIYSILEKHNIQISKDLASDLSNIPAIKDESVNDIIDKYTVLYNNSHLAYQSLDINGNIIETNLAWLNTLGYKKDEVLGKWFGDFLHTDYKDVFKERFERFKKDGSVEDVRFEMIKKNGEYILVSFKGCILYNLDGNFKCTYCSFVDITKETNLLKKLQESEENYRILVENQGEGIAITNVNEVFTFANPAAERIFGVDSGKLVGRSLNDFIEEAEHNTISIQTSLRKEGKHSSYELKIIRPDKSEKYINVTATTNYNDNGEFIGTFGVFRDVTEYKIIETELKESETKFKTITRAAHDAIVLINNTGEVIFWNKAAEKTFMYKESEILGKNFHNLIAPEKYLDKHIKAFAQFSKTGKGNAINQTIELGAIRKDGVEIPIELSISAIKLNEKWHAIGILRDISDRKENETKLKESEERFRNLSQLTFEGIVIHKDGISVDCNQSFLNLLNYENKESVINKNVLDFIDEKYHNLVKDKIINNITTPYEVEAIRKDGSRILVEVESRSVLINNATVRVAAIRDITARKAAEKAFLESEKKYSSLFSSMNEGVVIHEMIYDKNNNAIDYKIIELNQAFENHTAIKSENAKNRLASELYGVNPAPYLDIYSKVVETGEFNEFETYFPPMDKHFSISVFSPQKGKFATIFTDITERKKAEEKLKDLLEISEKRQKELDELNATKDRFFSIIAHDLRGPINNLVGFSDLLERNHQVYDKDKLSHLINLMNNSAQKTYKLLENLLLWSKNQREKISFNPKTYVCKDLVQEVIYEMQHLAEAKGISIKSEKSIQHSVEVDKDMFKTVYRNLISNAIKFTNEGEKIIIGCGEIINNMVEFFVEDTGIGISNENIKKLFKLDQSITTEGTHKEKGTGLGLILCKEFINKHGGEINVQSKISEGTKFTFTFPLSAKLREK